MEIICEAKDIIYSYEISTNTSNTVDLDNAYNQVEETKDIIMSKKGGTIRLTKSFIYLGAAINYILDNAINANNRLTKASREIGTLRFI